MGQLFDLLEQRGELENTLIDFTSDDGFLLGEHGFFDQKRVSFEESIQVPMLMRYPPLIQAGTISSKFVLSLDIAPTILDVAGVDVPEVFQGRSLLPLFKDPAGADWWNTFYAEYFLEKGSRDFPVLAPSARWGMEIGTLSQPEGCQ